MPARHPLVAPPLHPHVIGSADPDERAEPNTKIRLPITRRLTGLLAPTPRVRGRPGWGGRITATPRLTTLRLLDADPCGLGSNPVVCENSKPGVSSSVWDVSGAGEPTLQGFTTDISVNVGGTVHFKINSTAAPYRIDIYRLGWYQGLGARGITSFAPQQQFPQPQPSCLNDGATGLIDCGNWAESASWDVPSTAVSGVYLARLVRLDTGGASHVVFVVRDDSSHSDVLLQTSDATWEAYNNYGGNSLYTGSPAGRAYKVSYNRPFLTRVSETDGHNWIFSAEYPMIRFLERNGYDVSYTTDVDTARRGSLIQNHKVFMSSGHDEYWSNEQRASVVAARDAGVNLAFFSGNEMFWKTRWEPSIDGTNTSWRTMVTYKETRNPSPRDPLYPSVWTGTWRDPRYSPPSDGGRPENAVTGTMYMVDPPTDFNLKVPGTFAKLRFWRGTSVADLPVGGTATLAPATLGYEFDVDADNGFRPAGLVDLTQQTETVQSELKDYGSVTGPGVVTHSSTLYKAPSGVLVFGSGTIQWSFGLDATHDGPTTNEDPAMQQATVNLLADMHAQPLTLMSGPTPATASTDTTPPTSTVGSGSHAVVGADYTVTGTATDTGGVVGGIEVSIDGGATWHPATLANAAQSATWSYTFQPNAPGPVTVRARAPDDSGNLQSSPSTGTVTVDRRVCPCTIFGTATPSTADSGDASPFELGVRFRATIGGTVTGVRFYKSASNTGTHTGSLWTAAGQLLATGTFAGESASGWQTLTFANPVSIIAGTTYVASYHTSAGHYALDSAYFKDNSRYLAPLLALPDGLDGGNGVFSAGAASVFPASSYQSANYWVDVVFGGDTALDVNPPNVVGDSPPDNASSVPPSGGATATFDKPIAPGSVTFTLSTGGSPVDGSVAVGPAALSATFTPSAPLTAGATYSVSVRAADSQGDTMPSPATWTFRVGNAQPPPGTCPCTIWSDQQQPATANSPDAGAVELGVKFRTSADGYVTGVRFFKGSQNTGQHIGSLWTTGGTQLASATFTNETSTGWQQVTFDPAVPVTSGATYVASYHTDVGHYSADPSYFASAATTYGPLTALQEGTSGSNGVFAYGPASTFPTSSYQSGNYWVDPVFQTTPPPPLPPSVRGVTPRSGASGLALSVHATATFNKSVQPGSIAFTLAGGGSSVAGAVSYDDTTLTATFTPHNPLSFGTTYTASVSATGTNGLAMAQPVTWSFSTGSPATCPCSLWPSTAAPGTASSADTSPYELGARFRADQAGYALGVRFYKGAGNTGTHTGSVWTVGGQLLATGTFTGETASGWQTLTFDAPVALAANTDYVASYHTDTGHYAYDQGYFAGRDVDATPLHAFASTGAAPNGVYHAGSSGFPSDSYGASNYWVDAVFSQTAVDTMPPHVVAATPTAGSTGVSIGVAPTATFSEAVDPTTVRMTLTGSGSVTGNVSYDPSTRKATFTPSAPLATGTTFTASAQATDVAGNAMPSAYTWTFTTIAGTPGCPCTLLGNGTPAVASSGDTSAIELGVQFTSDVAGTVTGVRFYKGAGNTGTHTGSLWSAAGQLLATGTFTNETASGWQTLMFGTDVAIQPATSYVASYHTETGNYSYTSAFYANGWDAAPLHASSANGRYLYGSGGFPTGTYNNTNYWVDVILG